MSMTIWVRFLEQVILRLGDPHSALYMSSKVWHPYDDRIIHENSAALRTEKSTKNGFKKRSPVPNWGENEINGVCMSANHSLSNTVPTGFHRQYYGPAATHRNDRRAHVKKKCESAISTCNV